MPEGATPRRAVVFLEPNNSGPVALRDRVTLSVRGAHSHYELLVVPQGQTVTITNDDRTAHSLFSVSSIKPMELGNLPAGESRTVALDKPGNVDLFCAIHDAMQATIVVAPSSYTTHTNPQGSFVLMGIPGGRYRAVAYAPELGQASIAVEVKGGERSVIQLHIQHPGRAQRKGTPVQGK